MRRLFALAALAVCSTLAVPASAADPPDFVERLVHEADMLETIATIPAETSVRFVAAPSRSVEPMVLNAGHIDSHRGASMKNFQVEPIASVAAPFEVGWRSR